MSDWQPTPWTASRHAPEQVCDCHTDRTKHCAVCAEYGERAICECGSHDLVIPAGGLRVASRDELREAWAEHKAKEGE